MSKKLFLRVLKRLSIPIMGEMLKSEKKFTKLFDLGGFERV